MAQHDLAYYRDLGVFDERQLDQIELGIASNVDVDAFADPSFNGMQMFELRKALEQGLDISEIAHPHYDWGLMKELLLASERDMDLDSVIEQHVFSDVLNDYDFEPDQARVILDAFKSGADIFKIANHDYNTEQMEILSEALKDGMDISKFSNPYMFEAQMETIRDAQADGIDVTPYENWYYYSLITGGSTNQVYTNEEADFILACIRDGENVEPFAKTYYDGFNYVGMFDYKQMREIYQGMQDGLDLKKFAIPAFDSSQMYEVREGLLKNIDLTGYAINGADGDQLHEIRLGLEHGVDVTWCVNEGYDALDIRDIRQTLESELKSDMPSERELNVKLLQEDIDTVNYYLGSQLRRARDVGDIDMVAAQKYLYGGTIETHITHMRETLAKLPEWSVPDSVNESVLESYEQRMLDARERYSPKTHEHQVADQGKWIVEFNEHNFGETVKDYAGQEATPQLIKTLKELDESNSSEPGYWKFYFEKRTESGQVVGRMRLDLGDGISLNNDLYTALERDIQPATTPTKSQVAEQAKSPEQAPVYTGSIFDDGAMLTDISRDANSTSVPGRDYSAPSRDLE